MVFKYYQWVSRSLTNFENRHNFGPGPIRLASPIYFVLITAPIWVAGAIIYFLPFSFDVRFTLWIVLLVATIVLALRTAYISWKQSRR